MKILIQQLKLLLLICTGFVIAPQVIFSQTGFSGKSKALVVGINDYKTARHLNFAVADARAMEQLLIKNGFEVTNLYDERATRREIILQLEHHLILNAGSEDRVLIFFSGHGEDSESGRKMMGYLLPVDTEEKALAPTAISMGTVRELADRSPAKHVLFLIDACYGGIAGERFRSLNPLDDAYFSQITKEPGRQLITAGGANQKALEGAEWGHSIFTFFLIKGLGQRLADLNHDEFITASELYMYLDKRVFHEAQFRGHKQRPEYWTLGADQGEFVFAPVSDPLIAQNTIFKNKREDLKLQTEVDVLKREFKEINERTGRIEAMLKTLLDQSADSRIDKMNADDPSKINSKWESEIYPNCVKNIASKYPFTLSGDDASLQDVTAFFHPKTGLLWTFYNENLKPFINTESDTWVVKTKIGKTLPLSPTTLEALRYARFLSESLFESHGSGLRVPFDLLPYPAQGPGAATVSHIRLVLGSQEFMYAMGPQEWAEFDWPGSSGSAGSTLEIKVGDVWERANTQEGWWGLFRLLDQAQVTQISDSLHKIEWNIQIKDSKKRGISNPSAVRSKSLKIQFDLRAHSANNPFGQDVFRKFSCLKSLW